MTDQTGPPLDPEQTPQVVATAMELARQGRTEMLADLADLLDHRRNDRDLVEHGEASGRG